MRKYFGRGSTLLVVIGLAGCGNGPGSEGGSGGVSSGTGGATASGGAGFMPAVPTQLTTEEVCPAFIADACRALFECPDLAIYFDYPDEDACRADLPCRGLANFETSVAEGRFDWDPVKAADCHAALTNDLCVAAETLVQRSLQGVLALCPTSPAIGRQGVGEACFSDLDCVVDLRCDATDVCGGTCVEPTALEGEICETDRDCAGGLPCSGGRCGGTLANVDEECLPIDGCAEGLDCILVNERFAFVCVPSPSEGEPCSAFQNCLGGTHCVELPGANVGTCMQPRALGEFCEYTAQCAGGAVCRENVCAVRGAVGAECTSYLFGGDSCELDLFCSGGRCVDVRSLGTACDATVVCAEGNCVDGTCANRRELGAPCELDQECRYRACRGGVCVDPESCTED